MITLGIESTAHTFGVGIVKDGKVLANERDLFTTESGGMIPRELMDHHVEVCDKVVKAALEKAKLNMKKVDLISFSQGPGMGAALRIGAICARALSLLNKIPLIGVNHCIAHLEVGRRLTKAKDPVMLYASGANTQIIALEGGKYRIFGETLDQGIGNLLDSFARFLGLGFPGGPKIQEMAKKSTNFIELPYVVKGMDVSFGGILTNVKRKITEGANPDDIAYSLQETVFAMLLEVSERAMAHCDKKELLLGGGVACNTRLQEMAHKMCKARGAKCFVLANEFLVDNAAMIAFLGQSMYEAGERTVDSTIRPYERTDDIEVNWV